MLSQPAKTTGDFIFDLWYRCRTSAAALGFVTAPAVEKLIRDTREILTDSGYSEDQVTRTLFATYCAFQVWREPTDQVFESVLQAELAAFFERLSANAN